MTFHFSIEIPVIDTSGWWEKSKRDITRHVENANRANWPLERNIETNERWAPRRDTSGNWPLLRKTGRMQDTAKFAPGIVPMTFVVTTTDYGPFHQEGTSTIPQRQWLGIPDSIAPHVARAISENAFRTKKSKKIEF